MKQVEKSMENRVNIIRNLAVAFKNAANVHGTIQVSAADYLPPLAMFVYLIQRGFLQKKNNVLDGKELLVLEMGPSHLAEDVQLWLSGNLATRGLVCEANIDELLKPNYEPCRKLLREFYNPHQLVALYDAFLDAKLEDREYLEVLKAAENLLSDRSMHSFGEYANPESMAELVAQLLGEGAQSVYDPYMGFASFAMHLGSDVKFDGVEIVPWVYTYSQFKLAIAGIDGACLLGDSMLVEPTHKYDAVVTFPPMGVKTPNGVDLAEDIVSRFEQLTTDNGQMIVVVPMSFCSSVTTRDLREKFTEKNYVDKILSIPANYLLGTSVPCVMIHLKKQRPYDFAVVMNLGESYTYKEGRRTELSTSSIPSSSDSMVYKFEDQGHTHVSNGMFAENDYDWSPLNYPFTRNANFWRGTEMAHLMDYASKIRSEVFTDADSDVQILNLRAVKSPFDEADKISPKSGRYICVTTPAVAVGYSKDCVLYPLNASADSPIYLSDREIVLCCDSRVLPDYLVASFTGEFLLEDQIFDYGMGLDKNRFIFKWLQKQDFGIAPIADQLAIVEEVKKQYTSQKLERLHLSEYVDQLKEEYAQEVRSRKHNMRPYLRELKSSNDLAMLILEKATSLEEVKLKVLPLLQSQERSRKALSEIIDHLSQIDKFGEPEALDYKSIIQERLQYYFLQNYVHTVYSECLDPEYEPESPTYGRYIYCAAHDFRRMVDCIIENAIKHGFDGKAEEHEIRVDVEQYGDELAIRFSNDGLPFPKDFDVNRYGLLGEKAGKNAGTGDGGHQVVSIAKHIGGYVTIEPGEPDQIGSAVTIHVPIYDKYLLEERIVEDMKKLLNNVEEED